MKSSSFTRFLAIFLLATTATYAICGIPVEGDATFAFDNFRSLPEGSWEGNTGAFLSLNLKAALPKGYRIQLAGSYGLYDWQGRTSTPHQKPNALQQQGFLTGAVAREDIFQTDFNFGVAFDGMFNKNFGVFAVDPTLSQFRAQAGYLINAGNELGVWGSVYTNTAHKVSNQVPLSFRAISQVNLFWTHYFNNCAYAMVWGGIPCGKGLMYRSGRPGSFIVGARIQAPLSSCLLLSAHGAYMGPRRSCNGIGSKNYAANVCFGLTYLFGQRFARQSPYMTLADNSNFLVDTNGNF